MSPLRNVRIGRSYLHSVATDAITPYSSSAALRLLGRQAGNLRAQYSAAMLPLAFHYLIHPAYDYAGNPSSNLALPGSRSPESAAWMPSANTQNVETSRADAKRQTPSERPLATALNPPPMSRPIAESMATTAAFERAVPAQAVAQTNSSLAAPRKFSLSELGRALEAHNFPQSNTASAAVRQSTPSSVPRAEAAKGSEATSAEPLRKQSPAVLPVADIRLPPSLQPVVAEDSRNRITAAAKTVTTSIPDAAHSSVLESSSRPSRASEGRVADDRFAARPVLEAPVIAVSWFATAGERSGLRRYTASCALAASSEHTGAAI